MIDIDRFFDNIGLIPIPMEITQELTTAQFLQSLKTIVTQIANENGNNLLELNAKFEKKFEELKSTLLSDDYFINKYLQDVHDYCINQINKLINDALIGITFTLEDGHLVAYIPSTLSNISFSTDMSEENFGKLVIHF